MDLELRGKVAIVTGVAFEKGIGRAIALALAKEGTNVAVTDIILEGAQDAAKQIKEMGRKAIALKVDQSVYEEVRDVVAKINEAFGKIDILVNNAAIITNLGAVRKMEPSKWVWEISINLNGPWYWTREVLPVMFTNKWGRIVNISSIVGMVGGSGVPAYAASKGGLVALTKATAREGASRGVTANVVSCGLIDSGVYERGATVLDPKLIESMKARVPLGRMGRASEVADVVAFICSERASYITGANILVEGGILISV